MREKQAVFIREREPTKRKKREKGKKRKEKKRKKHRVCIFFFFFHIFGLPILVIKLEEYVNFYPFFVIVDSYTTLF